MKAISITRGMETAKKLEGKGKGQKKHTSTPIKIFFEHFIAFNFVTHDCHDCQEHHA